MLYNCYYSIWLYFGTVFKKWFMIVTVTVVSWTCKPDIVTWYIQPRYYRAALLRELEPGPLPDWVPVSFRLTKSVPGLGETVNPQRQPAWVSVAAGPRARLREPGPEPRSLVTRSHPAVTATDWQVAASGRDSAVRTAKALNSRVISRVADGSSCFSSRPDCWYAMIIFGCSMQWYICIHYHINVTYNLCITIHTHVFNMIFSSA